jgi:hypothetical protein
MIGTGALQDVIGELFVQRSHLLKSAATIKERAAGLANGSSFYFCSWQSHFRTISKQKNVENCPTL